MDLVRRCIPELFVNRYLMADADIDQRTILALRGNDPMTRHINTIVDYSLLWLLGWIITMKDMATENFWNWFTRRWFPYGFL